MISEDRRPVKKCQTFSDSHQMQNGSLKSSYNSSSGNTRETCARGYSSRMTWVTCVFPRELVTQLSTKKSIEGTFSYSSGVVFVQEKSQ